MPKFTEINKGSFEKGGIEYKYSVEVSDSFPVKKEKNVRIRVVKETPVIKNIRTRYDPEIEMMGDQNAEMKVSLGYDMKEVKDTMKMFWTVLLFPLASVAFFAIILKIPRGFLLQPGLPRMSLWILLPTLCVLVAILAHGYLKFTLKMLAEYLKAKDLKKMLQREGQRIP